MATNSRRMRWLITLLMAVFVGVVAEKSVAAPPNDKAKSKPSIRVTISRETTYITEPLRADGYPDYVAALNQRFSRGVTPKNNSAVLFWKAVGPKMIDKKFREKFFWMLGIPPLPEKGDYFVTSDEHENVHIARHTDQEQPPGSPSEEELREQLQKQFYLARKRPWSKEEYPEWAEWLTANEKPLALLVKATKRPRRYDPRIGKNVIYFMLPGLQRSRDVARALSARAMLRLHEGKTDEAWEDLLACHRLARLIGQGPTMNIETLAAITIDVMALAGDRALLEHGKLTSARIVAMREDFAKQPPMPKMVDSLNVGERFVFLDCVTTMARKGPSSLGEINSGKKQQESFESLIESIGIAAVDWDLILRMGNSWYDRQVEAGRKPTHAERIAAASKIEDDLIKRSASARDFKSLAWSLLGGPRKAVSERIGQIFVLLLLPEYSANAKAEDLATMWLELTDLAFALAAYRAEHGAYPAKLDELVPKYVKAIPKDIFNNDANLHYTRQDNGYLLYSVGPNGKDDGGKGYDDRKESEDWDDLVVRIPSKPEQ